jgi:hypothetical protein
MTTVLARKSAVPFDAELFQPARTIGTRKYGIAETDARNSLYGAEHLNLLGRHAFPSAVRPLGRALSPRFRGAAQFSR